MTPDRRRIVQFAVAAVAIAALALVVGVAAGWVALRDALVSYLFAYVFCLGAALGSLALLMIDVLCGGDWGLALRAPLLAAVRLLPLLAVLLLPILIGAGVLYPWAQHGAHVADPNLDRQRWYLNRAFFTLRAIACFAVWLVLAQRLRARIEDASPPVGFAGIGLVLYALTMILAATDWIESLVPAYHSSAFAMLCSVAGIATAAALAVLAAPVAGDAPVRLRGDFASLLLTLVLAWAYLAYMQFVTAWVADLPAETAWYLPRMHAPWSWLAFLLLGLGLVLPFVLLIVRRVRTSARGVAAAAALVLISQCGFAYWLVAPAARIGAEGMAWTDLCALLALAGGSALFFSQRPTRAEAPR